MVSEKIRTIASDLGYAAKPLKDYRKNPDQYKGHVGDVSTVIRIAVTGRTQSPDVWEIQQILGEAAHEGKNKILSGEIILSCRRDIFKLEERKAGNSAA